jgi:S1-C subfamily serine protease
MTRHAGITRGERGARFCLAFALALAAAGCASAPAGPDRGEVIRRIVPSAVQLRTEREGGARRAASGIVLGSDPAAERSWILTTRHFLDPPLGQEVWVSARGEARPIKAVVVAQGADVDLAVIEARGIVLPPVRFREVVRLGDEVLVVAFPWGRRMTLVSGVVSQIAADGDEALEGPPRMVDASVSYGSSGGGVFDAASGELVGIVESYRTARVTIPETQGRVLQLPVPGETTVIPARTILRFLSLSGLDALIPK